MDKEVFVCNAFWWNAKKDFAPERETLFWYCVFVVGRAGFEPATKGLKAGLATLT
jgi:hypothetical protein